MFDLPFLEDARRASEDPDGTPGRMSGMRAVLVAALAAGTFSTPARAQSWRVRFEASAQRVAFRGVTPDSVAETDVVIGPTGGPVSPDGFAVTCLGDGFCRYYRAGAIRRGLPASASTDLTMWGLGLAGLRLRVHARTLTDLTGNRLWPGTSPSFRLVEGYAEYAREGLTAKLGRMLEQSRLGGSGAGGLDGIRAIYRWSAAGVEVGGYAGWGLARGTVLPVTSPAVNPLAEFQPGRRQVVAGALAGVHRGPLDLEAEYRREVDTFTDYFVSERFAVSLQARPAPSFRVAAGADYDLAQGHWGSADVTLAYTRPGIWATLGARHYRPFFDLWTVWGVFSPVPHNGVSGTVAVNPITRLQLQARAEWFRYEATETSTPTVTIEDRGWRWGLEAIVTVNPRWRLEAGAHREIQPGAASAGFNGRVTWSPNDAMRISAQGGSLERPLEFRFQDASVSWAGGAVDYRMGDRWNAGLSVDRYWESRDRPDAAAFDWNQWRVSARVSLTLSSAADRWLPPGKPRSAAP
jgi:hypothetical protein